MKRFRSLLNLLFLLMISVGMTSCQGLIDAIVGDAGNPTTTQPTKPTTPQEPTTEEAKAEAVKLLNDAQKEGALVTIYFTLDGQDYVAYFKLVNGEYVLQEPASTRGVIQWSNKGHLKITLKLADVSSTGTNILNVTLVDETTGKTVMECVVDTQNATYAVVSSDNCSFGGVEVETEKLTLTEQTLQEVFGDTPVRTTDNGTIEIWDGNQWVDPTKENVEPGTMTVTASGYTGTYDGTAHGITITITSPADATVKYGTTEGTYDLDANPTYTNAGTYTVYYEVTKENYTTITGSATVEIAKKAAAISFATASISKTFGDAAFTNALTNTGDGKVTYESSNTSVATVNTTGEVTIKGNGEATIKATVADTDNYTYETKTATYTLGVGTATMTVTAKGYTGTYDGSAHSITVNAPTGATIKYGTTEGTYNLDTNPTYTNVGTYTVYYQVKKDGYNTVTGFASVVISASTMTVTATGYTGTYDGSAHGITVNAPSGATIKYGTSSGSYDKTSSPTYTNAGNNTVYYQVTMANYNTVTGSATVTINKAAGTISYATTSVPKKLGNAAFTNPLTMTNDPTATVSYSSDKPAVATVAADGTVTIKGAGTATITATVTSSTNYSYSPNSAQYTLTVSDTTNGSGGVTDNDDYSNSGDPFGF